MINPIDKDGDLIGQEKFYSSNRRGADICYAHKRCEDGSWVAKSINPRTGVEEIVLIEEEHPYLHQINPKEVIETIKKASRDTISWFERMMEDSKS